MRKPAYAICKQQRRRSACASAQSDQRLCFCCLDSINIQNFKPLASLCSLAGQFESHLVGNPDDRLSPDEAHTILFFLSMFLIHTGIGM